MCFVSFRSGDRTGRAPGTKMSRADTCKARAAINHGAYARKTSSGDVADDKSAQVDDEPFTPVSHPPPRRETLTVSIYKGFITHPINPPSTDAIFTVPKLASFWLCLQNIPPPGPVITATKVAETLVSTSITHRSDAKVSDWCLVDVDRKIFVIY